MFQTSTILQRPYGRDVTFPRLTADMSVSTATAEMAAITHADATVSSITAPVFKLARIQPVSN